MKIKFCGAAREVTGSSHLITLDNGYQILLDCGLYQGSDDDMESFNQNWYFDPKKLDCVVLSHAHIDHSGKLPLLYKHGFRGKIYATHATRSLCSIMLLDSAHIQERDAYYHNKNLSKGEKPIKPLYEKEHAIGVMELFTCFPYNLLNKITEGVGVKFTDAGHILGSASVYLSIYEKEKNYRIGFTGDIGRPNRPIIRDPQPMDDVDYLICESTYGDKVHESKPQETNKLLRIMEETCVHNRGKVIIPAFSIGRTQEIVHLMDQLYNKGYLPKIPIYVDSPLATRATEIYGSHSECYDAELAEYLLTDDDPFGFNTLTYTRNVEQSKSLNSSDKPCVIISASGMATAGRVRHHLYHNISDKKNTVLMVGYCSPYTTGGQLLQGVEEIRLFGETLPVRAGIERIHSLSAHGDKYEMLDFIRNQKKSVKEIFLVHGDYDTQQAFAQFLNAQHFENVTIPSLKYEKELIQ